MYTVVVTCDEELDADFDAEETVDMLDGRSAYTVVVADVARDAELEATSTAEERALEDGSRYTVVVACEAELDAGFEAEETTDVLDGRSA